MDVRRYQAFNFDFFLDEFFSTPKLREGCAIFSIQTLSLTP